MSRPLVSDGEFRARYGPWAVVAGGSVGMGAEYSRQLARRGVHVVLVAEAACCTASSRAASWCG